ncbi:MAG: hypothetical protein F4103_04265 [Boseongicola sp. SB0673_bin_14]|nr:hypothetical protein [Boseongicola sp. SB0673_bin_14]
MNTSGRNIAVLGLGAVAVAVMAAGGIFLLSQNGEPDREALMAALRTELPAYWSVSSIEIEATTTDKAEDPPVFRQRFVAAAAPGEDLFGPASQEEGAVPFVAIELKQRGMEDVRLHGIAESRRSDWKWQTAIDVENPVLDFGVPVSSFAEPALMSGSDDAHQVRSELGAVAGLIDELADLDWNWTGGAPDRLLGGPDEFALWPAIERELPAYLVLRRVDISTTRRQPGEAGGPLFWQEFKATVAPTEPLYRPARDEKQVGPFIAVQRTAIPTEEFHLRGTAASSGPYDAWATEVRLLDSEAELGLPGSGHSRPVVVAGSDEAARVTSKLTSVLPAMEHVGRAPWVSIDQLGSQ